MAANLLVISQRLEDVNLGSLIAKQEGMAFKQLIDRDKVTTFLVDHPQTVVFWDAQDPGQGILMGETLQKLGIASGKVFSITDEPINAYPHLSRYPVFGHHLLRKFAPPAPMLFSKLVIASLIPVPFGLLRYFPQNTPSQKITLVRSTQKTPAVEAVQNFLEKQGMIARLAALAAQATDELLMNAIFDAPVDSSGVPTQRLTDRNADFLLGHKEQVLLEVASCKEYVGLSVADQFGSLQRNVLMKYLMQDYQDKSYSVWRQDPGAGLGLHAASQSGISLLFVCQASARTEVMMFLPKSGSYKEFRAGLRFISILSG